MLGEIVARLDALNEMVQDRLLFARPRTPRHAPVMLGPLVEAAGMLVRRDPEFARVEIEVRGGQQTIEADSELLQIVTGNLMLNAGAGDERRRADHRRHRPRGDRCELIVRDSGRGVAPDSLERIFEPCFTTKHRGTGLGLPTARRLVELHGGTIRAACPQGGGSEVTVSLPATGRAEEPSAPAKAPPADAASAPSGALAA